MAESPTRRVVAKAEIPQPRLAAPVEQAPVTTPEQDAAALKIRHNRKEHFVAPVAEPGVDSSSAPTHDGPAVRKATPADFTSSFAVQTAVLQHPPTAATNTASKRIPAPAAADTEGQAPVAPRASAAIAKAVTEPRHVEAKPVEVTALVRPEPPVLMRYTRGGRLIVPAAMKGSHEILLHQNEMADHDGLDRVQDDDDLDRLRHTKLLVAIPAGPGMLVDERLPGNRRFCRPWTAQFLTTLARAHYAKFHSALQVNSAVRTVAFQQRLQLTNGNAAPAEGQTASPHLTGQAVDLAKKGLSMTEIAWLRGYLLPLVQQGKVDVEEEFQQACFHISVYRKYVPQPAPRREIARNGRSGTAALAVALR